MFIENLSGGAGDACVEAEATPGASRIQHGKTKNRQTMEKVIHCRDVGFDCDGVIRVNTEEALQMAAEHAQRVHGLQEVTPEVVAKVKSVMRDEPGLEKNEKSVWV